MAPIVRFIDFGYSTAREFWNDVTCPAFARFAATPTKQHAIESALSAWHVVDWLWHDGQAERDKAGFQQRLIAACPELAWVRDVAEGGKHRGLHRTNVDVKSVERGVENVMWKNDAGEDITWVSASGQPMQWTTLGPLAIVLNDGTTRPLSDVLRVVIDYWRVNWFK